MTLNEHGQKGTTQEARNYRGAVGLGALGLYGFGFRAFWFWV